MSKIIFLGNIEYSEALLLQEQKVEQVRAFPEKECIFLCSHPPCLTFGQQSSLEEKQASYPFPTYILKRGGKATYHGPYQCLIYPILHLGNATRQNDIGRFLQQLQTSVAKTVFTLSKNKILLHQGSSAEDRGLWWNNFKVASLGIAVKRWVTYHGMAINLFPDPHYGFSFISPCGKNPNIMKDLASIFTESSQVFSASEFEQLLADELLCQFF